MTDPAPRPDDPARKPTPMADWMAVWAEEDKREEAAAGQKSEADTHVLTPDQVWGAPPEGMAVDVVPVAPRGGDPAAPTTSFEAKVHPRQDLDPGLDGEIRQLLERTARYVKRPDIAEPENVGLPPGSSKPFLDFETPPGAWSAMAPPPLAFDEVAEYRDETAGRLGLLDPIERPWHNPPTPHGAPRKRSSNPPLAPFDPPSMTAPLPDPLAARKKPSAAPLASEQSHLAPIPWTDLPPPRKAAGERSTTRRVRDTARRVRAAIAPIAAAAAAEPAAPWLTLGTVAVSAAWFAVAYAAHNAVFAAVGAAFLAPFAISALAEAARRGQRP
ncbi:MAG: hypothetical protein FD180_2319 [Planctomycetota bacterium]|nr:MAG: hypothetical protein FD180_2319 [Planctomycetota bacterium]